MTILTSLQQRIHGTNFLNSERAKLLANIQEEFKGMLGKKVELSGGGQSAKFTLKGNYYKTTKMINGHKIYLSFQWFYNFSYRHVIVNTKVCINGGSHDDRTAFCQYIEKSDYLGELEEQMLIETDHLNIDACLDNANRDARTLLREAKFNSQYKKYRKALDTVNEIKDGVNPSLKDFLPKY